MVKSLKLLLLAMAMIAGGSASAQYQLANGNFDGDFVDCFPWEKGAQVTTAYGKQPEGWCISNVPNSLAKSMASQVDGKNGKAVMITNTAAMGNGIPAYLTLGTTWATAETRMTSTRNKDGGLFGGVAFTKHPDALKFVYTRNGQDKLDESVVLVYSWKGTWTQASVPSNTAVGVFSWGTAEKVNMIDRDVNILDREHILGGAVTKNADAELIAVGETKITGSQEDWKEVIVPIEYKSDNAPEKINVVFSAAGYQSNASITEGVSITIDDVEFVYNSELESATYDRNAVVFDGASATVDAAYDESKLELTSNGKAAKIETSYDETTCVLTITVKGDNISEDASNYHEYTIQFAAQQKAQAVMTITNAQYATFCAPMEVELPQGVKAYSCSQIGENNELALEQVSGSIPANTPVILWSESEYSNVCKGTVESVEGNPTCGLLTGVYEETPAPVGSYVLQQKEDNVAFYKVTSIAIMVGANRAYLSMPSSNAKALTLNPESATSIKALNSLMKGKAEIYDLNGRKRSTLQKGINIVNGTKVIVK